MNVSVSLGKRKRDTSSAAPQARPDDCAEPTAKRARPDVVPALLAPSPCSSRPAVPTLPAALLQLPRIAQPPPQPTLRLSPALALHPRVSVPPQSHAPPPIRAPAPAPPPARTPVPLTHTTPTAARAATAAEAARVAEAQRAGAVSHTVLHAIRLQRELLTPQPQPVSLFPRLTSLTPLPSSSAARPAATAPASAAPLGALFSGRPFAAASASSSLALASVTSALGLAYLTADQRATVAVRRLQRKHMVRHVKREHAGARVTPWSLDARVMAADTTLSLRRVTLHLRSRARDKAAATASLRLARTTTSAPAPAPASEEAIPPADAPSAPDDDAPSESRLLEAYLRHTVTQRGEARRALLDYYRVNPHLVPTLAEALLGRRADAHLSYARSPHSGRRLRAQLWRDTSVVAPWSRVMAELHAYWRARTPYAAAEASRPALVYAHVRPEHVAQINALLRATFWRDIDVSESLLWPEYTVVATWGRLVVGCALMTPQGYITYICVHPLWRRLGVSCVMLALLLQALPDRDVTLHVSVSNHDALALYHRFGFKPEEYILDFYKDYLPLDTALSVHAFLLRFRR